jgi:O-antigen/teichoic acid export membrane protein
VTPFSRNLAANLAATVWTALLQLAAVPAIVALAGVGGYALLGFYASLVGVLALLDLGLSITLTRKLAGAADAASRERARDAFATCAAVFWAVGTAVGAGIALAAPLLAGGWLASATLGEEEIAAAVRWMGLLFALRWPMGPYVAALQGLQRQVGLNAVNAAALTVATLGGVALLALVRPAIELFLAWQCACAAVQIVVLRALARRALPALPGPARLSRAALTGSWRFSSGVTAITLTGIVLTQTDKLILSKLVSLEDFGTYAVALALASALQLVTLPVFNAVLPRLSEHAGAADETGLRASFDSACALMNALLVPPALLLILFPQEILGLWLREAGTAARAAPLLALLAAGTLLNGFMNVPFALQLARGNTAIGVRINLVLCAIMVPAILALTWRYGVAGGAAVSPILNGLYLVAGVPLTYRICFGSRQWPAFYADLARRQGAVVLLLVAARLAFPAGAPGWLQLAALAALLAAALALSVGLTPSARGFLRDLPQRRA